MNDADRAPIKNSPPKPQKPSIALAHRQLHQSIGAARCKVMDSAGKLKRKTIYSPVSANAAETPIERDPTLAKLRYLDETTSTTDEDEPRTTSERRAVNGDKSEFKRAELDYDGTDQRKRRVLPPFEKCSPSSRVTTTRQPTARLNVQQQHNQAVDQLEQRVDFHDIDQDSDDFRVGLGERDGQRDEGQLELNEADLEEVYLCTCCGVTKPLDPAMKFIPMFRNLFLFTNFLVFALGLAGLGMGLWFRIDPKVYEIHKYIETQNFTLAGWIMLFAGFLACIMALVAFCSISKHPVCLLTFYSIVMTLLTISSIGSLVLLTVYGLGNSLERFLNKEIYEQIRRRTMSTEVDLSSSSDAAQFLDFVQVKVSFAWVKECVSSGSPLKRD